MERYERQRWVVIPPAVKADARINPVAAMLMLMMICRRV